MQFRGILADPPDPISLKASLEPGPAVLSAIDPQVLLGKPFACSELGDGRHLRGNRLRHSLARFRYDTSGKGLFRIQSALFMW